MARSTEAKHFTTNAAEASKALADHEIRVGVQLQICGEVLGKYMQLAEQLPNALAKAVKSNEGNEKA